MIDLQQHWTPTQAEFDAFATLSGDENAIHVDPEFCARTQFGRTVSHGMLIYSKLWGLLHHHIPNLSQTQQDLMFPNPAFAGEPLLLTVREHSPGQLSMRATRVHDNAACLIGEARVEC